MAKLFLKSAPDRRVVLPSGRAVSDAGEELDVDLFVQRRIDCGDLIQAAAPAGRTDAKGAA